MIELAALTFPAMDPVAIKLGPLAIRWYALAYILGLMLGWQYIRLLARRGLSSLSQVEVDDLLVWSTLAVILGGRLGYVLFYRPGYYLDDPLEALAIWHGGMSFHGGLVGVIAAEVIFAWRRGHGLLTVADAIAPAFPIGLFFGRIANFVNGELYGRTTDVPWAFVFPHGGPAPRHPSQLYEAGLEGLALFALLFWLTHFVKAPARAGRTAGTFLAGYGAARIVAELFREPDLHMGFLAGGLTMGQVLSLPMLVVGLWLVVRSCRAPRVGRAP